MNKKIFIIIIEYSWLVMAVFCAITGIYYQTRIGVSNAWLLYAMSLLSVGMFVVRRMQRKNQEKKQDRSNNRFK